MKCVWEVAKKCADMSLVLISEFPWISILGNLVENSRMPFLENDFKEMRRIA